MRNETRQQLIDRLISERTSAEAERYKDKQMDEPTPEPEPGSTSPRFVALRYQVGGRVRLQLDIERQIGFVTGVTIRQCGVLYLVTWGDTRGETGHSDFELEEADGDGGGSSSHAAY